MTNVATSRREIIAAAQSIIVKVGTRVLTQSHGRIALARLFEVVEVLAEAQRRGKRMLLVTSGAVGLGRDALGLDATPGALAERQACAAVGQSRLMGLYEAGFGRLGVLCAQVLLTRDDFHDRRRYLSLRAALATLLDRGVVPIINENDVVSTDELEAEEGVGRPAFGDNDRLSALVAAKLGADLLVLLTDVEGLFDRDPRLDDGATLLATVTDAEAAGAVVTGSVSGAGRGGMRTKLEAASIAARSGCPTVIASGLVPGNLGRILAGDEVGTFFPARAALSARDRWLAFASQPRGVLALDAGAVEALSARGASLLAAGVTEVQGAFRRGDVVELVGPGGARVGRGLAELGVDEARALVAAPRVRGARNDALLVRRDDLVLEREDDPS